jgi:hypothetical protein
MNNFIRSERGSNTSQSVWICDLHHRSACRNIDNVASCSSHCYNIILFINIEHSENETRLYLSMFSCPRSQKTSVVMVHHQCADSRSSIGCSECSDNIVGLSLLTLQELFPILMLWFQRQCRGHAGCMLH